MDAARRKADLSRRGSSPALALLIAVAASGCAHKTVIRTVPDGAAVYVDGEYAGNAPVVVERYAGTGGQLFVRAEESAFLTSETVLERTDWWLWPALLACTPFLGIPTLAIPLFGPFICGAWAIVTSPTLAGVFFLRRYPEEVVLTLAPRVGGGDGSVLPTDDWTVPDDYAPNPLPVGDKQGDGDEPLPQTQDPKRPLVEQPNPSPLPEGGAFRY